MSKSGLIYGFVFDGNGGGERVVLEDVQKWKPENGILWLHFDYSMEDAQNWIRKESGLRRCFQHKKFQAQIITSF